MRALVFDFDGVIVNSEPMHERAIRMAFQSCGLPANWTDWRRYAGHGDRNGFKLILADQGLPIDPPTFTRLQDAKQRLITELIASGEPPAYPGAVDLIRAAAGAMPIAVASGSRPHEIRPILQRLGVDDLVRTLVSADDVANTKPDPEPYLKAAQALGVAPEDCLAIEDTPTGVRAAVAAGFTVVGVEHTNAADLLTAVGAHHVVTDIAALDINALRSAWRRVSDSR